MSGVWLAWALRGLGAWFLGATALLTLADFSIALLMDEPQGWPFRWTLGWIAALGVGWGAEVAMRRARERVAIRDRAAWRAVAARLGLEPPAFEPTERRPADRPVRLVGTIQGVEIGLRCEGVDRLGRARCEIAARIDRPILDAPPWRRLLGRSARAERPRVRLGDPLLDGAVGVESDRPEAARLVIARDDLREPLMAVLHRWPESEVSPDGVTLRCTIRRAPWEPSLGTPPDVAALEAAARDAAALASALSKRGGGA